MFTRGGVYRVVKEALGGTLAKLSVSALMFDYILTGPISGVSAGQYIGGLINDIFTTADRHGWIPGALHSMFNGTPQVSVNVVSVAVALAVTVYFWWENIKGIHESSEKALRVMQITTVMVILLLGWSAITLMQRGGQAVPLPTPDNLKFSETALGFLHGSSLPHMFGFLPDCLRPLGFGDERGRVTGPGKSGDCASQAEEPEAGGADYCHLQPGVHRTGVAAIGDVDSG